MRLFKNISIFLFIFFNGYCMSKECVDAKWSFCNDFIEPDKNLFEDSIKSLDFEKMQKVKSLINTPQFASAYKKLIKEADKAITQGTFTVTDKTQVPPSGDKHDYLTLAPYWWPDSSKPYGLPWIRKDGEVNPMTRGNNTDHLRKDNFFDNVRILSFAYFFSDEQKYATKTIQLLKVWFINEDSKMNPNLNFGQGVPGVNNGRGEGMIEFADLTEVIEAIEILKSKNQLDKTVEVALIKWMSDYLFWMKNSKIGLDEKNAKNNHGTWYDVQEVALLCFLNRIEEAKIVLNTCLTNRIEVQIDAEGKQPRELARTKSLSYCTMNLAAFTQLANYGKKVNVDLWNYEGKNGASIKKAFEFLEPYARNEKKWEIKQIADSDKALGRLQNLFMKAGVQFGNQKYYEISKLDVVSLDYLGQLLYPSNF